MMVEEVKPEGRKADEQGKGLKLMSARVEPLALRKLKLLVFTTEKSQQELVAEALDLLFEKYEVTDKDVTRKGKSSA